MSRATAQRRARRRCIPVALGLAFAAAAAVAQTPAPLWLGGPEVSWSLRPDRSDELAVRAPAASAAAPPPAAGLMAEALLRQRFSWGRVFVGAGVVRATAGGEQDVTFASLGSVVFPTKTLRIELTLDRTLPRLQGNAASSEASVVLRRTLARSLSAEFYAVRGIAGAWRGHELGAALVLGLD